MPIRDYNASDPLPTATHSPLLVYLLLGGMMFFEYAIWGAWMPVLSGTLAERGVAPVQIGAVYSAFWLACILSPVLGGQLVDRFMPGPWFLALTQFLAAGVAWWTAQQTTVESLTGGMFVWSLLFAPSLGITNSIAFAQIERAATSEAVRERIFAVIRTLGSIGWIAAAFLRLGLIPVAGFDSTGKTGVISELALTAILGLCMAVFVLFLPAAPPKVAVAVKAGERADPLAFRKAFGMFKTIPGFTTFLIISFIAATEFQFFYLLSAPFLQDLSIPNQFVPVVKSISQVTEIVALSILLPLWLPKKGMKWCLLIGSLAWPLRYLIFALQKPVWLVVLSLGLHGFGYAFVLVVQQLYVDRVAPRDIRASAQSLLTLVTLGFGNFLGTLFCGSIQQAFTVDGKTNWPPVFLLPAVLTLLCAIAYAKTFREPHTSQTPVGTVAS
ncbi:MAG: MFS transporter [Akkermansiaceae bacterium]|nr:MFS transporter [Armatimonadota bacterium]